MLRRSWPAGLAAIAALGCTVNRALAVSPEPQALARYLSERQPPNLQVTDSLGRRTWVHRPRVVGDSLTGVLGIEPPAPRYSIPLAAIHRLDQPHFSPGRTAGLIGGIIGTAGVALLLVAGTGPDPVY
jgi:hypothetical protein